MLRVDGSANQIIYSGKEVDAVYLGKAAVASETERRVAALGVRYKQDARGQFAHSNVITILNAAGEIVHQQAGLSQDSQENVRVLAGLVDNPGPAAVQ
jgi:hypothetical protein